MASDARPILRCPNCDYSLQGMPGLVCPECGLTDVVAAARANRAKTLQQCTYAFLIPALFLIVASVERELDRLDLAPGASTVRGIDLWITHLFTAWCVIGLAATTLIRARGVSLPNLAMRALWIAAVIPLGVFAIGSLYAVIYFAFRGIL